MRWQQLLRGQLPTAEAESLEQHLAECDTCLQIVRKIPVGDTLEEALQSQSIPSDNAVPEVIQNLMHRLKQLRTVGPAPDSMLTEAVGLAGSTPTADRPGARPATEMTQESYDFLAPAQAPGELGRLAHYRVLKVLGAGGMGVVFKAEDVQLERLVALKVMRPHVAANPQAKQRFLREAKACAALRHDHIIAIHQVGEDRGVPCLAMEFLEGAPLDRYLDTGRKLTVPQILQIGRQIARGLAAAHDKGLVHRDIKPGNIWLEKQSGRAKILDFGLARSAREDTHVTQSGAIVGTPAYMAPEQARGDKVDARCDLFSLGCVLYRLCTGEVPFKGENTMAVLTALALSTPKSVRELNPAIPTALADLIAQLLAKEPDQRPASAKAVVEAIQEIERKSKPTEPRPAERRSSRRRWAVVAAAAALVAGLVLAAPIILRITRKDGTKQDIVLGPGDKFDVIQQQQPVKPGAASPFDALGRENLPAEVLKKFGGGDPAKAPAELVGVFGNPQEGAGITVLVVSPDGRRVYAGGRYEGIQTWDAATGKEQARLLPNLRQIGPVFLAGTPDGKRLARANDIRDGVTMLETATGAELLTFSKKGAGIFSGIALRPDGQRLAVIYGRNRKSRKVEVWDAVRGLMLRTLDGHTDAVEQVAYSPDGTRLATASADETLKIWDADSGKELRSIPTEVKAYLRDLRFSPDGTEIALLALKGLQTWDVATGTERLKIANVGWASFSPNGEWLATWIKVNQELSLRDASVGKHQRGWTLPVGVNQVAFAPDSRHLLTGNEDGTVCVLRLSTPAKP
jgi:serine/threonine protein kinase/DNA-binding beta-propeller fold protein YncE